MRSDRSAQIARGIFAFSVSFHGMPDFGVKRVGNGGIQTTLFLVWLLSVTSGKGVHSVDTLLNLLKVAKLLNAG